MSETTIIDRSVLRRRRVALAFWFVLIWGVFGALMLAPFFGHWAGLALLALLIGCYFIPAVIAFTRGHHNRVAIFILNLLLGWTVLGWVAAIVWACTAIKGDKVS